MYSEICQTLPPKILEMDFLEPVLTVGDKVMLSEEIRNQPVNWVLDIPEGILTITSINKDLGFPAYAVNHLPYLFHKDWLIKVDSNDILEEENHVGNQQDASDSDDADLPVCGVQVREELGEAGEEEEGVVEWDI